MILDRAYNTHTKEELRAKGLCYYYKEYGHIAKDCEKGKQANARWAKLGRGCGRPLPAGWGQTQWL